mgnify:CR=1 FL=1
MGAQDFNSKAPKAMGLTSAATVSLDPSLGTIFKITPDQALTINALSVGYPSEVIRVYVDTSGTSSYTITFGTNFRTTATLASGTTSARRFIVSFESDGLVWSETGRTAAMA